MAHLDERAALESTAFGATFLAALAYPESAASRDRFVGAILCKVFDQAPAFVEDVGYETVRLASLMQDHTKVETTIRNGARIINEQRIEAAFMAWPRYMESLRRAADCEPIAVVPTHASEAMLDTTSARIVAKRAKRREREGRNSRPSEENEGVSAANILDRYWKPSLPVLHMALALTVFMDGEEINIGDILKDPERLATIVRYSEEARPLVASLFEIQRQFPTLAPIFQKNRSEARYPAAESGVN